MRLNFGFPGSEALIAFLSEKEGVFDMALRR